MGNIKKRLNEIRMYWTIKRSGLFDKAYYLRNNLDVARNCYNPIMHYVRYGWKEGRNPSAEFDTKSYLSKYEDISKAGMNALYDYVKYGIEERKQIVPCSTGIVHKKGELSVRVCVSMNSDRDCAPGLISVIVPVYKSHEYLPKLLDSIKQQTYNNVEVIIVDDGSDEDYQIQEAIRLYAQNLSLSLHLLKQNTGANHARNIGFSKSTGEFLFFCDSDVILSDDIFEKMLCRIHEVPSASWVYCNYWLGNRQLRFVPFDSQEIYKRNYCSTMSLIRAKSFPGFDEEIKRYQDWDLFLTIHEKGGTGQWIDEFLFFAEDRSDGITNRDEVKDRQARLILRAKHPKVTIL